VSSDRVRHPSADLASSRQNDGFVAWGWPGWIGGIACWLGVLYFAYPTASAVYRGEIGPLSPIQWVVQSALYAIVFLPAFVAILYLGWAAFVVLRLTGDRITLGRWFGAHRVTYRPGDITTWRFVDRRAQDVTEAKSASRLRIDFADGSWVRLSRYGWNFRRLEAWLRRWAPGAARPVWRLPDDQPSAHAFVVRDVGATFLGLTGWVVLWLFSVCSALLVLVPRTPAPSLGANIHNTVMFFVWLILGPFIAYITVKDVRVDAARIDVKRWFGLIQRTYREDEIAWWRVSLDPKPPWWRERRHASIVIRFADKASVVVMENAANFHALLEYLRARALARHDVRQSTKTRWIGARRLVG
jgi:hypothetical protein